MTLERHVFFTCPFHVVWLHPSRAGMGPPLRPSSSHLLLDGNIEMEVAARYESGFMVVEIQGGFVTDTMETGLELSPPLLADLPFLSCRASCRCVCTRQH